MTNPQLENYILTLCNNEAAALRAFEMREEILRSIQGTERECWYICDETKEEFFDFFNSADCIPLGVFDKQGTLAAVGVGSYRGVELERFRSALPEGTIEAGKAAYIELIQVDFAHRGKGLQRALFEEFERRYLAQGVKYLTAIVSPHNYPSYNNFIKEGYCKVGAFIHKETGFERLLMLKSVADRLSEITLF